MTRAVTDTHGLIWYLEGSVLLGSKASQIFDACEQGDAFIYIPTICLVEILYLQEKGRIPIENQQLLQDNLKAGDSNLVLVDLIQDIVHKIAEIPRTIVPDMPDRIIAGTALYMELPLISKDEKIEQSQVATIW